MFRLAVADVETGILNINVSAIEGHKYAKNLYATLTAFIHSSPDKFVEEMLRLPDSDERNECILYFSVLMHELRHFLDILVTPYGAWRMRNTLQMMVALPQILQGKEPLIIPLALGADPFFARFKLGLDGFENSDTYQVSKIWKNHKSTIEGDNRGFLTENGRMMQFGGEAMLEALAFGVQGSLVQAFADDAAGLRQRFPAAFEDLRGPDPTHIDVTYRWYTHFQHMIGDQQTTGAAKLVAASIFASLCGIYHPSTKPEVRTIDESARSPYDLTQDLPSSVFQTIIGDLINRYEGKTVDEHLTWEEAWDNVERSYSKEKGIGLFEAIERDCEFHDNFFGIVENGISSASGELAGILEDAINWYREHLRLRRAALGVFKDKPYLLIDQLRQMSLFGGDIPVPIVLDYPTSSNQVMAGSTPVDVELMEIPELLSRRIAVPNTSFKEKIMNAVLRPKMHQRVYFSSFIMKGARADEQDKYEAWRDLLRFQVPFFKSLVYGEDPMDISGRSVRLVMDRVSMGFPGKIRFVKTDVEQMVVSSVENYMDFHGLSQAQCDICAGTTDKWLMKGELVSVSASALRGRNTNSQSLGREIAQMSRVVEARDWSENRVCRTCFSKLFPEKPSERYFVEG